MTRPSYEKLREKLLDTKTIMTMAHLGARAFGQISGEVVQTTTFVIQNNYIQNYQPTFFRLVDGNEQEKLENLLAQSFKFSQTKQDDFTTISGSPIAYWLSSNIRNCFKKFDKLSNFLETRIGMITGDNNLYIREWCEVSHLKIGFMLDRGKAKESNLKWFPQSKGGDFRRWYGNNQTVLNWFNDGYELQTRKHASGDRILAHNFNLDKIFYPAISWTKISSSLFSARLQPEGFLFNDASANGFTGNEIHRLNILGFLGSKLPSVFLSALNPTLNFLPGNISSLPISLELLNSKIINETVLMLANISKNDWDAYECSWDFKRVSLLVNENRNSHIEQNYSVLRQVWKNQTLEVQRLEQENNKVFIDAYGLADELIPDVPLKEITLTCNPHYRYGGDATEEQLEQRLQSDTIAELISYAIGCMMGRYSLDREGLVYAHEGNVGFDKLVADGAYKKFPADDDGILPLLDEERFPDDVYSRFEQFIATAWDKDTLQQNLDFIAESLRLYNIKPKNGESSTETIRRYLSNHFYKDQHLKTYKSRPIYWLFSSGKQKAFECLVYMHRFNDATLAKMRTQYVLPLMGQLTARAQFLSDADKDTSLSPAEKTKYAKEADNLHKKLNELKDFDAELKHHIELKISIDLDDGVKVNYGKFAKLLAEAKKVTGNKE